MSDDLRSLINPLVSSTQILDFRDGQNTRLEAEAVLFELFIVTQTAGYLLQLPQEVIATSIVLLQRYVILVYKQADLISSLTYSFDNALFQSSATAIYIAAKQSFYPVSPRSVINVFALIACPLTPVRLKRPDHLPDSIDDTSAKPFYVSEGIYQRRREQLFACEKAVLAGIGFDTKVVLPHSVALMYLSLLGGDANKLSESVIQHLNAAVLSPQLLYLTHQPNCLAVAAIYLVAREEEIALADQGIAWWTIFDVNQEELGFLVLSLASLRRMADASAEIVLEQNAMPGL